MAPQPRQAQGGSFRLNDLPLRWQLVARAVVARRERQLERWSFQLNQLGSTLNARRSNIRRLLGEDTPVAAYAPVGDYREQVIRRDQSAAAAPDWAPPTGEQRSREQVFSNIFADLVSADNPQKPTLVRINRALRAAGEPRATQDELDRAYETWIREE